MKTPMNRKERANYRNRQKQHPPCSTCAWDVQALSSEKTRLSDAWNTKSTGYKPLAQSKRS